VQGPVRVLFSPGENADDSSQEAHAIESSQEELGQIEDHPQDDTIQQIPAAESVSLFEPAQSFQAPEPDAVLLHDREPSSGKAVNSPPVAMDCTDNGNFTQMSPSALKSMCDEVDVNSNVNEAAPECGKQDQEPVKVDSLFSRWNQPKKFVYPSKRQIDESCPSAVFHLEKATPVSTGRSITIVNV
jgi:hypothetical protein